MGTVEPLVIYIGHDSREPVCTDVCAHSIKKRTQFPTDIRRLEHRKLRRDKVFNRPWLVGGMDGSDQMIDLQDGKTFSTEFSHTRFLVPHLMNYQGWALFMDADMVCLSDISKLFAYCDERYAVMCVKHIYPQTLDTVKMDNRQQRSYFRKNWSSFVLWNCGHPANKAITPEKVNYEHGKDLHSFSWLSDDQIGALPASYNYISGISPKLPPERGNRPDVVHYTDGGPWFPECQDVPYADWWLTEYEDWQKSGEGARISEVPTTRFET